MSYDFASGSSQRISAGTSPVSGPPLTMSCWINSDSISANSVALYVGNSVGIDRFAIFTDVFGRINAQTVRTGISAVSTTSGVITTGTWAQAGAVYSSATSRVAYLNGIAATVETTNIAVTTADAVGIGARAASGVWDVYFDGRIAEVGIWNAALTADEMAALAKGFSPRLIRPQSLVFYAPLVRDLIDVRGGLALTNNNTATVADHPRIYA